MKKLMKKIKSNSFISKAIAILTISMVLLSSLTLSSFAADDEVSAANEATDSITDTWTSVMNWITSSLGSAQGVFYNEGIDSFDFTAYGDPINLSSATFYRAEGLPVFTSPIAFEGSLTLGNASFPCVLGFDYLEGVLVGSVSIINTGSNVAVYVPNDTDIPGLTEGWYMTEDNAMINNQFVPYIFTPSASGASGLTFLGTLAVIGVAIAIAFLLISIISRFLRLRG